MIETLYTTFSFAEFEVDATRRRLIKNGETVTLNPKAFDLLLTLIENRGRLLTKEELLEKVWANQFVEENNLTVHISALRKALGEKKNDHRFIVTVPGKGYNFIAQVRSDDHAEAETTRRVEKTPVENSRSTNHALTNRPGALINGRTDLPAAPENIYKSETLVGREREIAEIVNLLCADAVNLITLTGTGGTGKTSLARAVVGKVTAAFPDGVFFVELAAASDTELVISFIAQKLGITESSGKSLVETIKEFVHERRVLLVLDNFEQILSAAPLINELLTESSSLKILVTSRHALRLNVEREFLVLPLDLPPTGAEYSIDNATEYPAVKLFSQRACAVKPNFALTLENIRAVAEICRRLDGLPLAIELAAARVKLLAPSSILDRLENSLKLLTSGAKDLPERQRTMRDTIRWSYDLLEENEKLLFRRLAVFAGGFTVVAAETIFSESLAMAGSLNSMALVLNSNGSPISVQPSTAANGSDPSALDLLDSLINNNLLVSKEQADGNARLGMLEVVREFALECLQTSNDQVNELQRCHASYFLALAETAEPHLSAEQSIFWLGKLEIDIDNLRAALRWSLENEVEVMTRLVTAARFYWINKSQLTEGIEWLNAALKNSAAAPLEYRFKLLTGFAVLKRLQGDYTAAAEFYGRALEESEAADDRRQIALASSGLGTALYLQNNPAAARKYYERGLAISRELKDDYGIAAALNCLGVLSIDSGETNEAKSFVEESLNIYRRLGNREAVGTALTILGTIAVEEGGLKIAQTYFSEGFSLAEELGNKINLADSLNGFAAIAAECGEPERAARLAGAADKLHELTGCEREPYEQRFSDAYLAKARRALDEQTFAAAFEHGRILKLNEVFALACPQPEIDGANKNQTNSRFSDFEGQSEIIIESHSFSRIIIEEELTRAEPAHKMIEVEAVKAKASGNKFNSLPKIIYVSLAAALLFGLLTFWFSNSGSTNAFQYDLSKLTTSGKVTNATLTPDSRYAVFAQTEIDGESLWLRHIATGSQNQILPAKPVRFVGLAVAPNGDQIYATIFSPALSDPQIWRVPLLGGSTEEIKGITTGAAVTFSPDGNQIAFIESRSPINENHLMISDADGANKKIVLRAHGDTRSLANFNANPVAWSPEGSEIACAVDEKNSQGAMKAGILLVNPADGSERFVSEKRWDYLENLTWIDAENLAFVAYTSEPWQSQIWTISKRTGEARQITKDLNSYSWLASGGGNLLTVQKHSVSYISISDFDEKTNRVEPREIHNESGFIEYAVWANDAGILYTSSANGKREIWRVAIDGSKPVQLTVNSNIAFGFAVSPVDGSIVFSANDNGRYSLKIMNAEGKDIRPLTEGTEDVYPNFAADGQTIVFQRGFKNKVSTMWRVSLADKNPVQVTQTHGTHPAISPDGTQTAHYFMDAETDNLWRIRIVANGDGAISGKLSFPKSVTERRMRWHPGGKFIGQIFYEGDNIKLLLLPVGGGEPQIVSGLGKGNVNWFDWSGDNRRIVVSHTTATQDVIFLSK